MRQLAQQDAFSFGHVSPIEVLRMRLAQITDLVRSRGWSFFVHELVFLNRTAIVVEKDLSEIVEHPDVLASADLKVIEIDKATLSGGAYRCSLRSRQLKALYHLRHGYSGIALVRGNLIVGDMWYWVSHSTDQSRHEHPDLRRFGFKTWEKDHVYTFDIFVDPAERKDGISAAFQNSAMAILHAKGYTRGFGFYWADNIPAHWCTRVTNKWKKLRAVRLSRFLLATWSKPTT
jgi:GNAT superfamily N-acetyltransferase